MGDWPDADKLGDLMYTRPASKEEFLQTRLCQFVLVTCNWCYGSGRIYEGGSRTCTKCLGKRLVAVPKSIDNNSGK